ncbi:DUF565 domain-containing protein [Synechococcus sp. CS-1328]|uniref:DUF565 domain-containing protein n=1 Tax=Synechococcus sp. CS-1328 TaxID=2847976 RepID=UPI00223B03D4|nr:DUF565 domain-containing protein [Synechococcus sp. CS-1328]MCT0226479.1 DUF565 domain-containing protein [Synechococcus sp. CS-1328]
MTRLPLSQTRWQQAQDSWLRQLRGAVAGGWRVRSLALLALLIGFYLGQNLTSLLLQEAPGGRPMVVLVCVLGIELLVRLRTRWVRQEPPLIWVLVDNLRMGGVYAVVLEAFKLGS